MKPLDVLVRMALNSVGRHRLTILIYHRVHAQADALFPNAADARRFDEQMAWIASALNIVPLPDAIGMLQEDRLPRRAACITFDDGYRDNLTVALPILLRHRLSATIFVASGFLDGGRMWNDTIAESIRRAPGSEIDLGFLGLGLRGIDTHAARRAVINEAIESVKYLPQETRQAKVDGLARLAGEELPQDLMLRSEEVCALHAAGVAIGAHTISHPILARLEPEVARSEIRDGRQALQTILGAPVTLFAYPNGKPDADYVPAHVDMVRESGFAAAVCTRPGTSDHSTDLFQLPRFTPWGSSFLRVSADLGRNYLDRH